MDATDLVGLVRHLVFQLERPRVFAERILVLDSRRSGSCEHLLRGRWRKHAKRRFYCFRQRFIDGSANGAQQAKRAKRLNERWFGLKDCAATHADNGAPVSSALFGFDSCKTRYVLQMDVDLLIGRRLRTHDYLREMLAVLASDPLAVTVAFNIASASDKPYTAVPHLGRTYALASRSAELCS